MSDDDSKEPGILAVRALPGANCSSVGSIVDLLFAAGAVSGLVMVAVSVALAKEPVEIVGAEEDVGDETKADDASAT